MRLGILVPTIHDRLFPPWIPNFWILLCMLKALPHDLLRQEQHFLALCLRIVFPKVFMKVVSPGTSPVSTEWKTFGGRTPESRKWFPFILSSFPNGRPCVFPPRISQKEVYTVKLHLSLIPQKALSWRESFLKLWMVRACVWFLRFLLTHVKLEEMVWSQRLKIFFLTPNCAFIFILKTESSLSFGKAVLNHCQSHCSS